MTKKVLQNKAQGSPMQGYSLAQKYQASMKVNKSDKHSSLALKRETYDKRGFTK